MEGSDRKTEGMMGAGRTKSDTDLGRGGVLILTPIDPYLFGSCLAQALLSILPVIRVRTHVDEVGRRVRRAVDYGGC